MNKKFWSGFVWVFAFLVVLITGFLYREKRILNTPVLDIVQKFSPVPLSIKEQEIKEENFTGHTVIISGGTNLAQNARKYVEDTISDFRVIANDEVPSLRREFGDSVASANYSIDISAKEIKGTKTDSIVLSFYVYTGGANGNSYYKTFTVDRNTQKILTLPDVIKYEKQGEFVDVVKKEINLWTPKGMEDTGPIFFEEEVSKLNINSFENWAFVGDDLVLYFDKYAIAPGSMGSFEISIKSSKIKDFLNI